MALSGRLSSFSLSDIFQILDRGRKTGRLKLQVSAEELNGTFCYYLWFNQGRIITVSSRIDHAELLAMMKRRRWIDNETLSQLNQLRMLDMPLGKWLENQGVLQTGHLKLLFHAQVVQRICGLFKFSEGYFQFDPHVQAPKAEMTGLSISTVEATLLGFRALKDWRSLEDKLPRLHSALSKSLVTQLSIQLDPLERKVWDLSNGSMSLLEIADQLSQPPECIQRTAFRLVVIGLVEELPLNSAVPKFDLVENQPEMAVKETTSDKTISQSFLQNLLGFLRSNT